MPLAWDTRNCEVLGLSLTVMWPLANNLTPLGLGKMRKLDYISGFQVWLRKALESSRSPTGLFRVSHGPSWWAG